MRHFRLYVFGALVLFGAGMWAWSEIDLKINYVPVNGTVVATNQTCHLEKENNFILAREKKSTNEVPCDLATAAVQPGQKFEGYTIEPRTNIRYSYTSPVDHAVHEGETWRSGTPDRWPDPGAPITIYAGKTKADMSKFVTR